MNKNAREIWMQIHILVCGRLSPSIMCMIKTPLRRGSMKIQQNKLYGRSLRVTMQLYLPMVRLELERLIRWKVSNTLREILREVLCLGLWRRSFALSRCNLHKTQPSWSVQVTCRYTMR